MRIFQYMFDFIFGKDHQQRRKTASDKAPTQIKIQFEKRRL